MEKYFDINKDGCSIRLKAYQPATGRADRVIIYGHGFGGHKDNRGAARLAERLLSKYKSTALVTFDWPCHGDDVRKVLSLDDCDTYLSLVTDQVRARFDAGQLYGCAHSFGGYLYLRWLYSHENPFERVVLRSPAIAMYDGLTGRIAKEEELRMLRRGRPVEVGFDRKVRINQAFLTSLMENDIRQWDFTPLADRLLIVQGTEDEIVSCEENRAFAARQGIDFVPVEGADHRFRDPLKMDAFIEYMLLFFEF